MNVAIISGNLGKDPEVKSLPSGMKIANFSVATTKSRKNGEEWVKETTWHNIVCFSKLAEKVEKYLKKGSKVLIQGEIQNRSYDDKDGNKKYISEIIANSIELLDKKEGGESSEQSPSSDKGVNYGMMNGQASGGVNNTQQADNKEVDELPF